MVLAGRCPRLPGGIVLGNQVGVGGRGDWGWGCVNRRHLPLPSLSCRSLYGPCLGSASVNHVDHPRADHYFRRQPGVSQPVALFASAMCGIFCLRGPVLEAPWNRSRRMCPPCSADRRRAPATRPVPRRRARSPHLSAPLHSPFGLAPSWLVSLMDACKFAYWVLRLPRYQKPESPTYLLGLSITLQYYRYSIRFQHY